MHVTRVALIVEIRVFRDALADGLADDPSIAIVASASIAAAVRLNDATAVDIALVASTAELLHQVSCVLARFPDAGVVVVGARTPTEIVSLAEMGVSGYVSMDSDLDEVATVIRAAARGEVSCPPVIGSTLLKYVRQRAEDAAVSASSVHRYHLTLRESEILALVAEGCSNKEIARRLCIELQTVKNHVHSILKKLSVCRRSEAAALAHREGRLAGWLGRTDNYGLDVGNAALIPLSPHGDVAVDRSALRWMTAPPGR